MIITYQQFLRDGIELRSIYCNEKRNLKMWWIHELKENSLCKHVIKIITIELSKQVFSCHSVIVSLLNSSFILCEDFQNSEIFWQNLTKPDGRQIF